MKDSKIILHIFKLSASLTVLGFYYPPEAGEKVSLEITILMALTFFMQVVSDMQPPSSQIPIISTYFTSIMVMVACSVVSKWNTNSILLSIAISLNNYLVLLKHVIFLINSFFSFALFWF